jgi:hypothetical protein
MEALYAMADPAYAQARLLAGRRHFDVTKDKSCGDEIVAFFRQHLSRQQPPATSFRSQPHPLIEWGAACRNDARQLTPPDPIAPPRSNPH